MLSVLLFSYYHMPLTSFLVLLNSFPTGPIISATSLFHQGTFLMNCLVIRGQLSWQLEMVVSLNCSSTMSKFTMFLIVLLKFGILCYRSAFTPPSLKIPRSNYGCFLFNVYIIQTPCLMRVSEIATLVIWGWCHIINNPLRLHLQRCVGNLH